MKLLLDENLSRRLVVQVVKLTLGNVGNATVLAALMDHKETVLARLSEPGVALVELTSERS